MKTGTSCFGNLFPTCQQVLGHACHIWYSLWLKSLTHNHSTRAGPVRIHCVMAGMFDRKWKGSEHYGNQSRCCLMRGRPLWPPVVLRLAARPSQSNPRGSGPDVLKRERGHVTSETGVAEVAVFGALQPNECPEALGIFQMDLKKYLKIFITY